MGKSCWYCIFIFCCSFLFLIALYFAGQSGGCWIDLLSQVRCVMLFKLSASTQLYFLHKAAAQTLYFVFKYSSDNNTE